MRIACLLLPDFEAALETGRHPELAGRPLVVGGLPHERKSVRSRSPEAAAHGVTEGMPLRRARGLCPDAVFLPPDEEFYQESFGRVLAVLDGFSPTVEVEGLKASDRGSSPTRPAPGAQHPAPSRLAGDACVAPTKRARTATHSAQRQHPAPSTQNSEPRTSPLPPAAYLDAEGLGLLFGPEGELGQRIATAVEKATGIRPRVGIGGGKFVARTAAVVAQPGSALVVGEGEERPFLAPLPVDLLPCSPETLRRLHLLGLRTVGQLSALEAGLLAEQFGPEGVEIHRLARGIDERPLVARSIPLLLQEGMEIDPPTDRADLLTAVADWLLERLATRMQSDYLACREVQIELAFTGEAVETLATTLHEPAAGKPALLRAVERLLGRLGEQGTPAPGHLEYCAARTRPGSVGVSPAVGDACVAPTLPSVGATHASPYQAAGAPAPTGSQIGRDRRISALRITLSGFGGRQGEQMELFRSRAGNIKRLMEAVRESEEQFGEDAIRSLAEVATERARARPLTVKADAAGRPQALLLEGRWEGVQELCNRWRVQEEWWRRERYRDYFRLITDNGRLCLVFRDLRDDSAPPRNGAVRASRPRSQDVYPTATGWFLERIYE